MRHGSITISLAAALQFLCPTHASAQQPTPSTWIPWDRWPTTFGRMALDPLTARPQILTESQWLQWNGATFWPGRPPLPATHFGRSIAIDPVSGWLFAYAFHRSIPGAHMLAFDGRSWRTLPMPALGSSYWSRHVVFDSMRGQMALIGLVGSTGIAIWHWNGSNWTSPIATTTPLQHGSLLAAMDLHRGRLVVLASQQHLEWDGTRWHAPGPAPSVHALGYDPRRRRMVAVQLYSAPAAIQEYDGASWTPAMPTTVSSVSEASICHDPALGEMLILAGSNIGEPTVWSWNGVRLQARGSQTPDPEVYQPLFDPMLLRMTASSQDRLLAWEGDRWASIGTGSQPSFRTLDAPGQRVVGMLGHGLLELRGGSWVQFATLPNYTYQISSGVFEFDLGGTLLIHGPALWPSPPVSLLYDRVLGFQPAPAGPRPTAQSGFAARLHPASGGIILFGGTANGQDMAETWRWASGQWLQLAPAHAPSPRVDPVMAVDPTTGDLILAGGRSGAAATRLLDAWSWNGTDWQLLSGTLPFPINGLAFDPMRGTMTGTAQRRLAYYSRHPSSTSAVGSGCGGRRGPPTLMAIGDPSLGNESFALRVGNLDPGTPAFVLFDFAANPTASGPCPIHLSQPMTLAVLPADLLGGASIPVPVPFVQPLRGLLIHLQAGAIDFAPGALYGEYSLSAGLRLTLGD